MSVITREIFFQDYDWEAGPKVMITPLGGGSCIHLWLGEHLYDEQMDAAMARSLAAMLSAAADELEAAQ